MKFSQKVVDYVYIMPAKFDDYWYSTFNSTIETIKGAD